MQYDVIILKNAKIQTVGSKDFQSKHDLAKLANS